MPIRQTPLHPIDSSPSMENLGFMQGRLTDLVAGQIQAFPWDSWEKEFSIAPTIGLHIMEWTLDYHLLYSNPLMLPSGQAHIRSLCSKYDINIPSLTGDCFMQAPFWKSASSISNQLRSDFISVCDACIAVGIKMIVVPLVDSGSISDVNEENLLVNFLLEHSTYFIANDLQILFESDYAPIELKRFIDRLPLECFGINYDIGNSAALGYDPAVEFLLYGNRIANVHVKDRILGGSTVALFTGSANFELVFSELRKNQLFQELYSSNSALSQ